MSNAKVLVDRFLTHPDQIKWVRVIPASVVDLCLSSPSLYGWMKLLDIEWNWSLSPIIFLNSLPRVLKRTIGQKDLGEL